MEMPMSGMCNKCQVALSDMVDRFLSSGIGIDYQINTQMLKKSTDGTWQPSNQTSDQTSPKGMTKQGSVKIATPDLVVGMILVCLLSGLCMGVHGIKRMFQ